MHWVIESDKAPCIFTLVVIQYPRYLVGENVPDQQ
ncbi:Uncharacterised protein [Serratia rubidaea]|nr:Uncharacterised protein [Serratia rubidaea]